MKASSQTRAMWLGILLSIAAAAFLLWRVSFRDVAAALPKSVP